MKMDKKKMLDKMKGKMPSAPSKDAADGADPMFDIPEDEQGEDGGDVDNKSANVSPDAHTDEDTVKRAGEEGDLSEDDTHASKPHDSEEGSPEEEANEDETEKARELSDDALHAELKRRMKRGKPSTTAEKETDKSDDDYSENPGTY